MAYRSRKRAKGFTRKAGTVSRAKRGGIKTIIPAPTTAAQRRARKMTGMRTNGGVSTSLKARSYRIAKGFNRKSSRA